MLKKLTCCVVHEEKQLTVLCMYPGINNTS